MLRIEQEYFHNRPTIRETAQKAGIAPETLSRIVSGKFVFIPDAAEAASVERVELFADAKDVNNVREVAEAFGVCQQTIRRLIASGELESVHVGRAVRVTRQAMIDFFVSQGVSA